MEVRKFEQFNSLKEVASSIAGEVVKSGKSEGWAGCLEDLDEVKSYLSKFNIAYVDDIFGKWAYRKKE